MSKKITKTRGPEFLVTTRHDAEGWWAELTPIGTKGTLEGCGMNEQACVGHGRRMLETAVRDAVAHYLRTWGKP